MVGINARVIYTAEHARALEGLFEPLAGMYLVHAHGLAGIIELWSHGLAELHVGDGIAVVGNLSDDIRLGADDGDVTGYGMHVETGGSEILGAVSRSDLYKVCGQVACA